MANKGGQRGRGPLKGGGGKGKMMLMFLDVRDAVASVAYVRV